MPTAQPQPEAPAPAPPPPTAVPASPAEQSGKRRRKRRAARNDSLEPNAPQLPHHHQQQQQEQAPSGLDSLAALQQSENQFVLEARSRLAVDENSVVPPPPNVAVNGASQGRDPQPAAVVATLARNIAVADESSPLRKTQRSPPFGFPRALASARKIDDLDRVMYPEDILTPVNINRGQTKGGKYK